MDDHIFTFGFDPASGDGDGFQLDAILSYQVTNAFSLGAGGRWWHVSTSTIDSFDQLLTYDTDRYGAFVQAASLQLIQCTPTTNKVRERPLLMVLDFSFLSDGARRFERR
jgi:hypothetical protein